MVPHFCLNLKKKGPQTDFGELPDDDLEVKHEKVIFTLTSSGKLHELLVRYSSWTVLLKRVAWLLKFKAYLKHRRDSNADDSVKVSSKSRGEARAKRSLSRGNWRLEETRERQELEWNS